MEALRLRQTQLLEPLLRELRGDSRALFDALDNRQAAFKAAVDSVRPRVPAALYWFFWFDDFNKKYAFLCDDGAKTLIVLQGLIREAPLGTSPAYFFYNTHFLHYEYVLERLAVYDKIVRCMNTQSYLEVSSRSCFVHAHALLTISSLCEQVDCTSLVFGFCPFAALPQKKIEELLLHWARSGDSPSGVRMLVQDLRISLAAANRALRLAAARGHSNIIQPLVGLSLHPGACASALRLASKNGHVGVIIILLADHHVHIEDLGSVGRAALRLAQDNHHSAAVKALMADDRIAL